MAGRLVGWRLTVLLALGLLANAGWSGGRGSLGFVVDWAAFRADETSARLEFAYGVPHDQLRRFVVEDGRLVARFVVDFEIAGLDNGYRETGTFGRRASLRSFAEAEVARRVFVDQFSVVVPAGTYMYRVTVAESTGDTQGVEPVRAGTVVDTVQVPDFRSGMSISSLQLGADVLADTATGEYALVPNPGRRYGLTAQNGSTVTGGSDRVLVYFEGYNLVQDTAPYLARCFVLRGRGGSDTALAPPALRRAKSGRTVATVLGVSIDGLAPGDYLLGVELTDMTTGRSVVGKREFTVGSSPGIDRSPSPYRLEMGELERKYYSELNFIATPREIAYYNSLPDSGREAWLAAFWSRRNLTEFARRMELAETRYATGRTAGTRTDRGRGLQMTSVAR